MNHLLLETTLIQFKTRAQIIKLLPGFYMKFAVMADARNLRVSLRARLEEDADADMYAIQYWKGECGGSEVRKEGGGVNLIIINSIP